MSDRSPHSRPARFTPTLIALEDRAVPAFLGSLNDSLVVLDPGPGIDPARASVAGTLIGDGGPVADGIVDEVEPNQPVEQDAPRPPYTDFAQSLEAADPADTEWVAGEDPEEVFPDPDVPHVTVAGTGDGTYDYYTFEVPADDTEVWLSYNFDSGSWTSPIKLFVFDADDGALVHSVPGSSSFVQLAAGTYALAVGTQSSMVTSDGLLADNEAAPQPEYTPYRVYLAVAGHAVGGSAAAAAAAGEGSDTYSLTLGTGEQTSLAVGGTGSDLRVEVLDANGDVVAGGGSSVAAFTAPAAGTYTVRVSGTGGYELVAGVNATADAEPNDSRATAQHVLTDRVHRRQWVTGTAGAGDADFYRVNADARTTLTFASVRPAGAPGDWVRPLIRVYNEAGTLVASNAGNRNQDLTYQVPRNRGGAFVVEVSAPNAATAREYAVSIRGANTAAGSVAAASLAGDTTSDWLNNLAAIEEALRDLFARLGVNVG